MPRKFVHPLPGDFQLESVLYALADPVRLRIVKKLKSKGAEPLSCSQACDQMSPSSISFHYRILRESGLIHSRKLGTQVLNELRVKEMNARFPGLLQSILKQAAK